MSTERETVTAEQLVSEFPEINIINYNEDDVAALNEWGCRAVDVVTALTAQREADRGRNDELKRKYDELRESFGAGLIAHDVAVELGQHVKDQYNKMQQRCEALERERDVAKGNAEFLGKRLVQQDEDHEKAWNDHEQIWQDKYREYSAALGLARQQLAAAQQRVGELEAHERQTHERLGAILGTDDSLEEKAKQLKQTATGLREALEMIAAYGVTRYGEEPHDGLCIHGCDCPHIARQALAPPQQAQRVVGGEGGK